MLITDYTTYADVRAILGVSTDDLEDATLALSIYVNLLESDLESIDSTLPGTHVTIKAVVGPTAAQSRFLRAAAVFATFSVGKQLTASLPLFAAKKVTDSKAGVERFAEPYRETIEAVKAQYDTARKSLVEALAGVGTAATASVGSWAVAPPTCSCAPSSASASASYPATA